MVCAAQVKSDKTAKVMRRFMAHFHNQKEKKGVDEMLFRLYEPILWRSLKAANATGTSNSANSFFFVPSKMREVGGVQVTKRADVRVFVCVCVGWGVGGWVGGYGCVGVGGCQVLMLRVAGFCGWEMCNAMAWVNQLDPNKGISY